MTLCPATPGPAARKLTVLGLTVTPVADVEAVGDGAGVGVGDEPLMIGVCVGDALAEAVAVALGDADGVTVAVAMGDGDGAVTGVLPPPPPHATSASTAPIDSGANRPIRRPRWVETVDRAR